ncbi:MAG: OmpA family protein [Proteobacteria bacterium]|nr:OmpA family protein [Pseudomonadota bacterium]MBU1686826.1 OmpA family protein [Pseudomonadota bacterium]
MSDDESKQEECPAGAPAWMCTFADLMSLLMTFFILLLSFSEMDRQKFKQVAGSMEKAFGVQREVKTFESPQGQLIIATGFMSTPMAVQLKEAIEEELANELAQGSAELDTGPDGMTLRIKDSLAFDLGHAEIKDKFKLLLDKIGKVIATYDAIISVKGHTDNIPLAEGASYRSNWSLSAARAVNVVEYWAQKFKIPSERMFATGYADGIPLVDNNTPENRARNRRVEFLIRPGLSGKGINALESSPSE